jgi:alpha-L-arabinofuranosidase
VSLKARKLQGAEGFLVAFGRKGQDKYWWNVGGWGNTEHAIEFNQNPVGPRVPGKIETNRWYALRVEVRGRNIRCFLDGQLVHDETAPVSERLFALAGRGENGSDLTLKVINGGAEPVRAELNIGGGKRVAPEAEVTVLTSANASDNNSLDNPREVVPMTRKSRIEGSKFEREFPRYSFTLLKLKTE